MPVYGDSPPLPPVDRNSREGWRAPRHCGYPDVFASAKDITFRRNDLPALLPQSDPHGFLEHSAAEGGRGQSNR
jgi:hypothetical protein